VLDGLGAGELLDRLAHVGPVLLVEYSLRLEPTKAKFCGNSRCSSRL
jgi:hypothetical protein